jgi:TonB family protein
MLSLSELNVELRAPEDARPLFVQPEAPQKLPSIGAGALASVAVHLLAVVFVLSLVKMTTPPPPRTFIVAPRLVAVVYMPSPPLEMPKVELPPPPAPKVVVAEEPKPLPVAPVKPIEIESTPTPAPPRVVPVAEAPRPTPPAPAPPTPTVGVFPQAAAAAQTPTPAARVESAGFDALVKQAAESKLAPATVGAFDSATNAGAKQSGSANPTNAVVTESGFGRPAASVPSSIPQGRVVRESGFGTSASREQPKGAQPPAEVKAAGFGPAVAAPKPGQAAAAAATPTVIPVEVLFKPTPIYTEEARKLKLEGDVVLEVDFLSSGALRVIRVVRGLGHGLDEAAVKAAEQIRFKPAQDNGKAVDSRTTVSIVFRLA